MKKLLSAVLSLAMVLSLFTAGASAVLADLPEVSEGKIFGGYYTDSSYARPSSEETAFIKEVDAAVLTVKFQTLLGANEQDESTKLRVVTTVDSLNYKSIGIKISVGGGEPTAYTTKKVAKKITGSDGLRDLEYGPAEFSPESEYFCAFNITVPKSRFNTELRFTPFWVTMDGQEVEGTARSFTISENEYFNLLQINNASELTAFAQESQTRDFANWTVKLTADIDMNPGCEAGESSMSGSPAAWTQIGSASMPFAGTFDGQGHTISGVYMNTSEQYAGLFAKTAKTAVLKDFRLENSIFLTTAAYAGSIAGSFAGTAEHIYSNATVRKTTSGNSRFGGFFGTIVTDDASVPVTISDCWYAGLVSAVGNSYVGGIIGALDSACNVTVTNCLFDGALNGSQQTGGICGNAAASGSNITMSECLTISPALSVSQYGGLIGGRQTADSTLTANDSVCICGSKWYGNSGTYSGNAVNVSSKTVDQLKGAGGIFLDTWLDFENVWTLRANDTPALKSLLLGFEAYTLDTNGKKVYTINNASDMASFAAMSGIEDFAGSTVVLAADIDMNPGCEAGESSMSGSPAAWTQIGSASMPFAGTFDGQGHTISGVYMNTSEQYAGLFAKTAKTAVLKDFRLENSIFLTTAAYAGSIAGSFAGTAEHIYSNATVRKTTSGNSRFGGFFGTIVTDDASVPVTISDCWYAGLVSAVGNSYVGGIIGALDSACNVTVTNCLFDGALNGSQQTGGICGNAAASGSNITMSECLTISPALSVSQYGGLIGGRQTADSTLTANDSVCICGSKWYGNSGTYSGNAVNVSSKTVDQLKGAGGIFLDTWLDFENVWTLREGTTPVLMSFVGGSGPNTLMISTADGLKDLAAATKTYSYTGWTVKLCDDIDLNPGCEASSTAMSGDPETFAMIGSSGNPFGGTFDGQGHTISGAYVTGTSGVGLFHATSSAATIKDLKLTNSFFTTSAAYGGSVVCFFAGRMEKVFSDSFVYKSTANNSRFGGLAATVQGGAATFSECWFDGSVKADGNLYVGGIVGGSENSAGAITIEHCLFTGSISCGGQGGGIFGYMLAGGITFEDTLGIGSITTSNNSNTGTLFGGRTSSTPLPQLVVRNTAAVGTLNFLGSSAADTKENADGISSRTRDDLKGIDGIFLDRFLDFENYWTLRDSDVPALRCFVDSVSSAQTLIDNSKTKTANSTDISRLSSVYAGTTLYQGDMHAHADADGKIDETAALAQWKSEMSGHDLDFIASLDHRQTTHIENAEWDKDLFLYGTEPGTYVSGLTDPAYSSAKGKAHYLMLFKNRDDLLSILQTPEFGFNYSAEGDIPQAEPNGTGAYTYVEFTRSGFADLANAVKNEGGLFVFAHPYAYSYSNSSEDYFVADGTGLEVLYGSCSDSKTKQAYSLWKDLLAAGHKVWATAGSDIHGGLDTQEDHDTNPNKAEKAVTSVWATADTGSTNKADLIMDRLVTGNFTAGHVGIKMCVGSAAMGSTTDFNGKRLVAEIGGFSKYVSGKGYRFRVNVYAGSEVVYSNGMTDSDTLSLAFDAKDNVDFYRIAVIDETNNRVVAYGNPIWND